MRIGVPNFARGFPFALSFSFVACNLLTGLDADYQAKSEKALLPEAGSTDSTRETDAITTRAPDATTDARTLPFCDALRRGVSNDEDYVCTAFDTDAEVIIKTGDANFNGWNIENGTNNGRLELRTGGGVDGSNAAEFFSGAESTAQPQKYLYRQFSNTHTANTYKRYDLEFDFYILSSTFDYEALALVTFTNDPNASTKQHGLAGYGPQTPHIVGRVAKTVGSPTLENQPLSWRHAHLSLVKTNVTSSSFEQTLLIDKQEFVERAAKIVDITSDSPTFVRLGVFYTGPARGSARVRFDNVMFRRTPP